MQDLDLNKLVTEADIEGIFKLILGRQVGDDSYRAAVVARGISVRAFVRELMDSPEFALKFTSKIGAPYTRTTVQHAHYRVPPDLQVEPDNVRGVLLVGSCLFGPWAEHISAYNKSLGFDVAIERITFNNASALPVMDSEAASKFDFQILQIPIRSVLPEGIYFGLRYLESTSYKEAFAEACARLELNLDRGLAYNTEFGITTFVLNFPTPQQNPMGRLLPRYTLENMVFFFEELNRRLFELCSLRRNVHFIDFAEILSTHGKRYFQDDVVLSLNHGSFLSPLDLPGDKDRLEPLGNVPALYAPQIAQYVKASYHEILGAYRTIRQKGNIKIAIFDLDDTLWRGVGAEADSVGSDMVEGWPLGVLEAVSYLWRRGVLVALVSKNDETTVLRIWRELYESRFPIENFVVRKINWRPKAENVDDILRSVNLLSKNALFVDDNPVERAAVASEHPDIRVLNAPIAHWRRILMWSPETQSAVVTDESGMRTQMTQAQIERDGAKASMGRMDFLKTLNLRVEVSIVRSIDDKRYERCLELLNKTNQFNTTGKRWAPSELQMLMALGGYLVIGDVHDRYTPYGLVALVIVDNGVIEQFVMSCRVFGMEVETAILAFTLDEIARVTGEPVRARIRDSGKNALCHDVFKERGFVDLGAGVWEHSAIVRIAVPTHVRVVSPLTSGEMYELGKN